MSIPQPDADPRATAVATPYRLARATVLVLGLFLAGAAGYRLVEGAPWWDAFYMTVITITTVGYDHVFPLSPAGEALTVALLGAGIGVFLFLASEVGRSIMEGELRRYLGRVRRVRMIGRMSGHDIVCGYGRMGRAAVDTLRRAGREVVVVEARGELTADLVEAGCPVVTGDATREASLRAANVEKAGGLVCCLADDAHNLYAVLTARSLNPGLVIAARAVGDGAEQRILQAGADRVVNPYQLGGARLAQLLVEPAESQSASPSGPPTPAAPTAPAGSAAAGGSARPADGRTGIAPPAPDKPSLSEPRR